MRLLQYQRSRKPHILPSSLIIYVMLELTTIEAPPDWTGAQDIEDFEDRFCGFADILEVAGAEGLQKACTRQVANAYRELHTVLDSTLNHLGRRRNHAPSVPLVTLTIDEKCELLLAAALLQLHPASGVGFFRQHIAAIRHYDRERGKVLRRHWDAPEQAWLFELGELADALSTVALHLHEFMTCYHSDYTDPFPFRDSE